MREPNVVRHDLQRIRYRKEGQVAYIELHRPEVLNAIDSQMHEELGFAWDDFENDVSLHVAVLAGSGTSAFSVGQDLKEVISKVQAGASPGTFGSKGDAGYPRLTERHNMAKPVIARVDGFALGGGFELALACDILLASEEATFGLPEAKLGLIPGAGGIFRLTRQVPMKIAMGLLMTGQTIGATRAYEIGLVNEVVARSELDQCVNKWVTQILSCAPLSLRTIKQVVAKSHHLSLEEAFEIGKSLPEELTRSQSKDAIEGPQSFVDGRNPVWRAR